LDVSGDWLGQAQQLADFNRLIAVKARHWRFLPGGTWLNGGLHQL